METGNSVRERVLLYTILDTDISINDKLDRLSEAIRQGADLSSTLGDDPALSGLFPLLLAVSAGDGEVVSFFLAQGADVNQTMDEPYFQQAICPTPLHQACLDGRLDLVQILAEGRRPMVLEPTNARGQTPLHLAVESGNTDLVGYLVELGSWVQASDMNGNNALHMASCIVPERVALDMIDTLINLGVSIRERNGMGLTPVKQAMILGKESCARMMLSSTTHGRRRLQEMGFHPLEAAVANRNRQTIAAVLKRLASSSEVPKTDESLNMLVLNPKLNEILYQLLSSPQIRSLVNMNGSLGYTPLYNACASRNTEAVRMLLEAGADPDGPSQRQHVLPLKKAVLQNDLEVSKLLLRFGASGCHCVACSPILRRKDMLPLGPKALAGIKDGELDLLYLALFTDQAVCRLLISAGTCISSNSQRIMSADPESVCLYTDLYEAGHHAVLRKILLRRFENFNDSQSTRDDLQTALKSPASLKLICRTEIRKAIKPKVHWAAPQLPLPSFIKSYLLLET